jgi:hypothetical protein
LEDVIVTGAGTKRDVPSCALAVCAKQGAAAMPAQIIHKPKLDNTLIACRFM